MEGGNAMANRGKGKRKSTKCPEPFNTLIDIAGAITMHAIANSMEKKHHYHKRGVPNPYRATAFGMAAGRINDTEDIIRLGSLMGAMGSFDEDPYETPRQHQPRGASVSSNYDGDRNKYAWRLNCEDGTPFGVSPSDYETRTDYNAALSIAKGPGAIDSKSVYAEISQPDDECNTPEQFDPETYIFCKVSRLDNGANQYFRASTVDIPIGKQVTCMCEGKEIPAIVISVGEFARDAVPASLETTGFLLTE